MTHTFKLPSGVECEIKELTGKEQEMMTVQDKKPHEEKLAKMLASVIVRVGEHDKVTLDFIQKNMLSCDMQAALMEVRQFSMDFEDTFTFHHTYRAEDGSKRTVEISEKIKDGKFTFKPLFDYDESGELVPVQYEKYSEIKRQFETILPKSGKRVRFNLLDGTGEAIASRTPKNKRSSNTALMMRQPVYFHTKEGGEETPIQLDLTKLGLKDIEHLRKVMKDIDGRVDTEILFENPSTGKDEPLNVLSSVAFFFPSGTI